MYIFIKNNNKLILLYCTKRAERHKLGLANSQSADCHITQEPQTLNNQY